MLPTVIVRAASHHIRSTTTSGTAKRLPPTASSTFTSATMPTTLGTNDSIAVTGVAAPW